MLEEVKHFLFFLNPLTTGFLQAGMYSHSNSLHRIAENFGSALQATS